MRHKKTRRTSLLEQIFACVWRMERKLEQLCYKEPTKQKNTIKLTSMYEVSLYDFPTNPHPIDEKEIENLVRDRLTKQIVKYMFDQGLLTITSWDAAWTNSKVYHGSIEVVIEDQ